MSGHRIWLGLGANLGDPAAQIGEAVRRLREHPQIHDLRESGVWRGPYRGPRAPQPEYLNQCVAAITDLSPRELLDFTQALEREAGREAGTRDLPRRLDIDLLLFDTLRREEPGLQIPHPRLRERRFVLEPLAELDPELPLPPDGVTVRELLADPEIAGQELERCPGGPVASRESG